MKMLTGLLPATDGEALLFGHAVDAGDMALAHARRLHVAIILALYRAHGSPEPRPPRAAVPSAGRPRRRRRIDELVQPFRPRRLSSISWRRRCRSASASACRSRSRSCTSRTSSSSTSRPPASIRWRAIAFWELLIDLSRNQGVTIFVSTHFMNEAARCDRISLMDAGRVLATDTPAASSGARRRDARGSLHRLSRGGGGSARNVAAASTVLHDRAFGRRRLRRRPRCSLVQPAAAARLRDPRSARADARSDPAAFRAGRHGLPDADLRLRHHDRRQHR